MGPRRNVRGGAQQPPKKGSSGKTAMGLAAASVVAATAAGGVLWYQKNNKKNYIIDMFIEACNNFNDSASSGTIGIKTFYNLKNITSNDFLGQNTQIQKQRVKQIYDEADKMVKKEFNVKLNESLNEYPDDFDDSVLCKLNETNIDPKIYLTNFLAYFRLTCYFVSFDCFIDNEWVLEKIYDGYIMILFPRFLERFLSLCFQFDDKFNFEFYKRIETVELHNNIESYAIYRHPGGIVLEESTFDLLLASIRHYKTNVVNIKKFEMQKECLKQKYEKLNTDLHSSTESSAGAGAGTGTGAGLEASTWIDAGAATGSGHGENTLSRFEVGAGAVQELQVNQEVWYNSRHYMVEYPAKIREIHWDKTYDIDYTDNQCYNSQTGSTETQQKLATKVERTRLRPRKNGEEPKQRWY
jgi:hypothetical protein